MMDIIWSIFGFVVAIGVLVAFHEFGHYWVARRCGVRVLRFSIGFGRPIWSRVGRNGVEFVIAAIPLGGYVKMLDERESDTPLPEADRPYAFNRQSLRKRAAIVAAGPAFNFMLAAVFYWAIHVIGVPDVRPVVAEPPAGSLLAEAGITGGSEIVAVNDTATPTWTRVRMRALDQAMASDELRFSVIDGQGATSTHRVSLENVGVDPEQLFAALGLQLYAPTLPPRLAEIVPDSPAADAGLQAGDLILGYDGVAVESWRDLVDWLRAHPGETTQMQFERDGTRLSREVVVGETFSNGERVGQLGARVEVPPDMWADLRTVYRENVFSAAVTGVQETFSVAWLTLRMMGRMVIGQVSVDNISGPLQIAEYAGYTAAAGLTTYIGFLALISVSLGVLNLLPVPMLDGGHLMYYLVEAVKGSPVSDRVQIIGQQFGLVMLAGLMGLAFFNDLSRIFG